ncbi:MAG: ABC transporter permease [Chthoniobacterales bacterium]|nr:ABC transporter permease [Chthoniobacterales bacterium]
MRTLRAWWSRIAGFVRPGDGEREFAEELQSHIDLHTDDNIRAGMTPEEARRQALLQIGGVAGTRDAHRDRRGLPGLEALLFDLKIGGRMLVKYPGLTIVGGLAMAFAIWVGIVSFQVVGLFTHPTLPLSQGARLVEVRSMDVAANDQEAKILHDFLEWQQSLRSLTDVGAWRDSSRNLVVADGDARPVNVAEMSVAGFRVSDGEPLMGRVLVDADEQPATPAVAVIGYDLWRTRFGSDPHVVGRTVQLGSDDATVVGVMREGFEFPASHDVWLPLKTSLLDRTPRSGPAISVFALLAPGETMQTAQAELTTAGRRAATASPATHLHLEPRVRPYATMFVPDAPGDMAIMYSVYVFVAVLLILICGNVGLLLFARAASREADLLVRTALGASRGRIVTQMFAEALVLGGVAAIVGVTAAGFTLRTWGVVFLETNLGRLPFWFDLSLSPRTFAVAIVLTVACAAVAGIMPALKITRGMGSRLKQTTAGSGGLQFGGVWTVVIVAQVAATVIFPGLVYVEQSLLRGIRDFDPGFASEQYLAVQIERDDPVDGGLNVDAATLARNARLAASLEEFRRKVAEEPGVAGVTFAEDLPTTNHPQKIIEMGYDLDGGASAPAGSSNAEPPLREATIAAVDPSYFEVLDAPVLAGRGFTTADAVPGTRVAIVDHGFVDQILQGRNAVGQQVRFRYPARSLRSWGPGNSDDPGGPGDWYEVIGVVRELGVGAPTQAGRAAGFYIPATPDQFDLIHMMVHLRGGDPMTLAPQVREVATAVDPSLRLVGVQRLNEANNDVLWVMTMWLRITVVLSGVALVLSLAGIFAVLSFTVARRTREIGVRVALGASRRRVVAATFRRPFFQVALGVVVGTAIIFTMATLMQDTELPGSETDLTLQGMAMILGYGVVMLGVCMLGCVVPTRRALNIEPTIALRIE